MVLWVCEEVEDRADWQSRTTNQDYEETPAFQEPHWCFYSVKECYHHETREKHSKGEIWYDKFSTFRSNSPAASRSYVENKSPVSCDAAANELKLARLWMNKAHLFLRDTIAVL